MTDEFELPQIAEGEDKTSALKNRIRKNYRHIRKWAKRTRTNAFRIYDRDIKEYPLAIDFYNGRFCVQVFSYDEDQDESRFKEEIEQLLSSVFEVPLELIYWKIRIKRERLEQYEKLGHKEQFFTVLEYGVKFYINLQDYLDTGLFLDHRETRQLVAKKAAGKRMLNLFAYTGSFSVQAAIHGASFTKSVDMSNTYTQWTKDNFLLNDLSLASNEVVREDCLKFLKQELIEGAKYDLIVIDPPTISRSKKMDQLFDIQEDYVYLVQTALKLLTARGVIYFSTNSRKFVFDETLFPIAQVIDITAKTLPLDFHNQKIHKAWQISLIS